jgi:hypothetical protein
MKELLDSINGLLKSCTKQPLMSFVLIIFLVMIWIQVYKLDAINQTLISIHSDNIRIHEYIIQEKADSCRYAESEQEIEKKLAIILDRIK